jgi:hypothetical protein
MLNLCYFHRKGLRKEGSPLEKKDAHLRHDRDKVAEFSSAQDTFIFSNINKATVFNYYI